MSILIEDILNKRYSTRSLSDEEFYNNIDSLASQLSNVDYKPYYDEKSLRKDWYNLCKFNSDDNYISSTSRIGMKICEHFFPNFYDIQTTKGFSFSKAWQDIDLLKKILVWNRKSHSTPYLSELKRGIYFCSGSTKSTMYRPQISKIITRGCKTVFDPCAGWAGRMIGAVANKCKYYAFEPNTKTYENLQKVITFLGIEKYTHIINDSALNFHKYDIPKTEICLTSPPYFNLEIYSDEETQSIANTNTYEDWIKTFLNPLIKICIKNLDHNGRSCWNVANIGKYKMWDDINHEHMINNYEYKCDYNIVSSARQVNQNLNGNRKSIDKTVVYSRG